MGKRVISRKDFILKASAGIPGLYLPGIYNFPEKPRVTYRLGKCGLTVSRLCFEASMPGNGRLLEYAIDKGVNFIDTARTYGNGNSEKIVGKIISGIRNDIVLSTKIGPGYEELSNKQLSRQIGVTLRKKSEESLTALKTDYLDMLLFHDAVDENLLFSDSTLKFFSEMKRSGVIRACGFSANKSFVKLIERNNREGFYDIIMIPFNQTNIVHEHERFETETALSEASEKGTGIIAMKVTGRDTGQDNLQWALSYKFINSAVIVAGDFGTLKSYMTLL